jgi:hypothetical protein
MLLSHFNIYSQKKQNLNILNIDMKKLEAGEITTEQAKEINDLAYDKYIMEGVFDKIKKSKESKKRKEIRR